jgi:hypothetical protein
MGGGSFNKKGRGSEICNFKEIEGEIYGFFSPPGRDEQGSGTLNIDRIAPHFVGDELGDVTVIFLATDRAADALAREKIVGWYRKATVLRVWRDDPTGLRWALDEGRRVVSALYNVLVSKEDAVLLPTHLRRHLIPRGKGGMGQANVRYLYNSRGKLTTFDWMNDAIRYVESYKGENLLTSPLAETAGIMQDELEIIAGYESNARIRKALEKRAMDVAKNHYVRHGYAVHDKSQTESYDLLCHKAGARVLVEVKGTRTDGGTIVLTTNEVKLASRQDVEMDLCVVHSIIVSNDEKPEATGGTLVRYENWNPKNHGLQPVQYICRLVQARAVKGRPR